jgi:hypothetical protein
MPVWQSSVSQGGEVGSGHQLRLHIWCTMQHVTLFANGLGHLHVHKEYHPPTRLSLISPLQPIRTLFTYFLGVSSFFRFDLGLSHISCLSCLSLVANPGRAYEKRLTLRFLINFQETIRRSFTGPGTSERFPIAIAPSSV